MNCLQIHAINEVHVEISSRCRLHCLHCSSDRMIAEGKAHFDTADLKNFLEVFTAPCRHVYLTGGEPLLWEPVYETIGLCKSCGFSVGLFTTFCTGEPVEKTLSRLQAAGLDDFYVSIYDADPSAHDRLTGVAGSYSVSKSALLFAKKYGISPKVNFVLLKQNIPRLGEILKELDGFGVDEIRILKLVRHGNADRNWEKVGVSEKEQREAARAVFSERFEYNARLTFAGFPDMTGCRPFGGEYNCGAGKTLLYIDHFGDVYPCASLKNIPSGKVGTVFAPNELSAYSGGGTCGGTCGTQGGGKR